MTQYTYRIYDVKSLWAFPEFNAEPQQAEDRLIKERSLHKGSDLILEVWAKDGWREVEL